MELFVSDKFGNILPPYAVGELIICGESVGRGYVKLPEKNAASYYELRGQRAYHSGDLVRMNGDGEIEFGGRMDNQVKLRGFRVELDEIENVMCSYPSVRQSKVLVRNNGSEDYLVGFYTAGEPVPPEDLTAYLKTRLTYYMVPAALMQLEQMPLTQNGKMDKKAFPEVQQTARRSSEKRAPKKSTEEQLCELFRATLSLDEFYADDNFFEMGGTSLSASKVTMQLMSKSIKVEYQDIFDHPTPESLGDYIDSLKTGNVGKAEEENAGEGPEILKVLQFNTLAHAADHERDYVAAMARSVRAFTEGAEQHDDITMLAFTTKETRSLELAPDAREFAKIRDVILSSPLTRALQLDLCVAAEECFVNICSYAFEGRDPAGETVRFDLEVSDRVVMRFTDGGMAYDPRENVISAEDYDMETQIGGLGKLIAFTVADEVDYEYTDRKNILTITKYRKESNHDDYQDQ